MPELSTELAVHRSGTAGRPQLLLLHGLTDSGLGWADAAARWGDRFDIVAVDHRGHGESPRFTAEQLDQHPGELMVDDAIAVLEQLDRPVVVGHSLGGAVALAAAVRRPDLVRALVLEDPAPRHPAEEQRVPERGAEYAAGLEPARAAADDEALLALRRQVHPDWPETELLPTGHAEQQTDLDYLRHGDWKPTTPWPELFGAVTVPTLVVSGDREHRADELCVNASMQEGLARLGNDRIRLEFIPGAGHCVRRDATKAYHAVVDPFLAEHGG